MEDAMKTLASTSCVLVALVCTTIAWASPPSGVTPTVISRGTYEPFKVKTDHDSLVDFEAKAKADFDMVVRQHDYAPHAFTGWHTHPGPVFITVLKGTLTFYEYDDPTCTPNVVTAGEGYVDDGHGHIGVNDSDQPALDVSVILAPVGLPFRGELDAPSPYCGF
jgi:Cupin domain